LDSVGRYYIWLILVITGLNAAVRLARPRLFAEIESERLANPRTRRQRAWLGGGGLLLSPLLLLYGLWKPLRPWIWVSILAGVLSGAEQFAASRFPEFPYRLRQAKAFGFLSAVAAVAIYLLCLRG
jgi:hypothetical protein